MNRIASSLNLLLTLLVMSSTLSAQQATTIEQQVRQVLPSGIRTDDERNHVDNYRKPAETLAFFGLRNDMRVLELIPGGGYYTKILGQVLAENGKLYLGANTAAVAEKLPEWGLDKVEVLDDKYETTRGEQRGFNNVVSVEFPVKDLDMALTFRNMHNMSPEGRKKLNTAVFNALKSGGIYGVIDHTRRHMEPYNEVTWRRVDPVTMIKELQDVGFIFEDYSDVHYRPQDELKLDSTDPAINRDSDRFTLKFRKP
jgi:predicted methyltransferase